jgi:hypothetical protein
MHASSENKTRNKTGSREHRQSQLVSPNCSVMMTTTKTMLLLLMMMIAEVQEEIKLSFMMRLQIIYEVWGSSPLESLYFVFYYCFVTTTS